MQSRSQRFPCEPDVRFYRIDELISAPATDVSASGLFVSTQAWLPINGVVDMAVSLPGGATVLMPARVAHCLTPERAQEVGRMHGMGFCFIDAGERETRLWSQYLRRLGSGHRASHEGKHRVMVASHNRRLIERLINALQPVARELSFYDVRRPPLPFQMAREPEVLVIEAAYLSHPHVIRLREQCTAPVVAIACSESMGATQAARAGAASVIDAPFNDQQLCDAVAELAVDAAQPHMAGDLGAIETTSILSMLAYERRDGVLLLLGPAGTTVRIVVEDGHVCDVRGPSDMPPASALSMALSLTEGRFEFRKSIGGAGGGTGAGPRASRRPISAVLLDHARMCDEMDDA